ncbi:hypothetical protein CGRA01v4_04283 [Colletotrichum graminicola]|nr:hypothetical protein CGRA01v4_04283 [Colletotrichum graminicola]
MLLFASYLHKSNRSRPACTHTQHARTIAAASAGCCRSCGSGDGGDGGLICSATISAMPISMYPSSKH